MPRSIELSTLELVVAREALQKYKHKADVKATEYEAELAKAEGKPYNIPLIHPRLIADAAQQVLDSVNKALTAEAKFPKAFGATK
jgi:hypothetical protein